MSDESDPLHGLVGDLPDAPVERTVERSTTETLLGRVYEHSDISEDEFDVLLDLVAHEIRTPFALIEGQARLLIDGEESGAATGGEVLRSIHRNAVLGLLLLERLTDLRSVDEGRIVLNRLPLDVVEHTRRTIAVLDDVVLGLRTVEIHAEDEEPITCQVDPARLRQIIFNLLANAALNTPPGAPINVHVSREDGAARIEVRDDGHGVAPDEADEVFEKFPRLDATRQGPGVGLYVSRGLARAHGGDLGTIPVDDADQGVFVLTLPCDPPGSTR